MKPSTQQNTVRHQPVYPRQEPEMDWLRPIGCFGIIGIFVLLIILANLPQ